MEVTLMTDNNVHGEMVEFLRKLSTADGTPILDGEQPEDVAFALAANVDLMERFVAHFGFTDTTDSADSDEDFGYIEDGFGSAFSLCDPKCTVEIVRPGKAQCNGLEGNPVEPCPWGNTPWLETEPDSSNL